MSKLQSYIQTALLLLAFVGLVFACQTTVVQNCAAIPGLATFLKPGQIILLGEIHGTKEGPGYIEEMACNALENDLSVCIALELPKVDITTIQQFLDSKGQRTDQNQMLQLPFWSRDYQDGRASQAMFELIDYIRMQKKVGQAIDLILIDDPAAASRDFEMAQNIIHRAENHPDEILLVLTGNYHNTIFKGSEQMGDYVLSMFGPERVLSLKQSYTGGTAWVDIAGEAPGVVKLKGYGKKDMGILIDPTLGEYHGTLEVDSIHHSLPAKNLY